MEHSGTINNVLICIVSQGKFFLFSYPIAQKCFLSLLYLFQNHISYFYFYIKFYFNSKGVTVYLLFLFLFFILGILLLISKLSCS